MKNRKWLNKSKRKFLKKVYFGLLVKSAGSSVNKKSLNELCYTNITNVYYFRANEKLEVDASQPTTSIQIRLADGSRLSGRFNLTHRIADLRSFITK